MNAPQLSTPPTTNFTPVRTALGIAFSWIGALLLIAFAVDRESFSWAFVLGVPFSAGLVFGQLTPFAPFARNVTAALLLVGLLGGALTMDLSGLLCGAIAAAIFIVPTLLGAALGSALRIRRSVSGAGRVVASLLVFGCCALLLWAEPFLEAASGEEVVATERVVEMDAETAWRVLMFYEDVDAEPPPLARIGLPLPQRTVGKMTGVGDFVRCVYSTGHLVKRVTEFEPGRRLGFDVIEQHGIEDRSAELLRGSFAFEALPGGRTRITLETVYRPLLGARPVWRPFEIRLARTLHRHVLDGMQIEANREDWQLASSLVTPR
jgi:hypothetical protein